MINFSLYIFQTRNYSFRYKMKVEANSLKEAVDKFFEKKRKFNFAVHHLHWSCTANNKFYHGEIGVSKEYDYDENNPFSELVKFL